MGQGGCGCCCGLLLRCWLLSLLPLLPSLAAMMPMIDRDEGCPRELCDAAA